MLPLSKAKITVDEKNVNPLRAADVKPLPAGRQASAAGRERFEAVPDNTEIITKRLIGTSDFNSGIITGKRRFGCSRYGPSSPHWGEKGVRGQGENTLKLALACIMEYIKVGKEERY